MPFNRPTLDEIESNLIAEIDGNLDATDARVRRSVLGVLARAFAGALHLLYGFLNWITQQTFPWSAEAEYLEQWATIWGLTRSAAVAATGSVEISGTASTSVPAGTTLRSSSGQEYTTDEAVSIAATGTVEVDVTAVVAGAAGNAADAARLTLTSPIAGVESAARASGQIGGGVDQESDDSLRRRLTIRLQTTPRGGTDRDYVEWGLAGHASVTRAWARPLASGLGTVTVYLMSDDATDDGIPTDAVVTAVQAYIDARRPITADVTVAAPTAVAMDVTINNAQPDTQAVQDAIEAELLDLIRRDSEPGGTILISRIREAISVAVGETDHVLISPTGNVTHTATQIAVLGDVTFTSS